MRRCTSKMIDIDYRSHQFALMENYRYSPFSAPLENLAGPELKKLEDVAEGWFIEYKRAVIDIKEIARHLAAFANQRGGWLFFGITEKQDGSREAGGFPGITNSDVPSLLLKIREATSAHVSPPVYYEEKVISGPIGEINLDTDKSIIIIGIPQGHDSPYIHSSGRIFVRVADESKPTSDRHELNLLWERSEKAQYKLNQFLSTVPDLSRQEEKSVHAYVYILPHPYDRKPNVELNIDSFSELFSIVPGSKDCVLRFDNYSTTIDGFIARQIKPDALDETGTCLRWWNNGNARFTIPIPSMEICDFPHPFMQYKFSDEFRSIALLQDQHMRIADFTSYFLKLAELSTKYLALRDKTKDERKLYARLILLNTWRISPYYDSEKFLDRIRKYGIPIVEEPSIYFPAETHLENLPKLMDLSLLKKVASLVTENVDEGILRAFLAIRILVITLRAMGIASDLSDSPFS